MKIIVLVCITIICAHITAFGQEDTIRKTYVPAWSFQQKNATIYGISVGLASTPQKPKKSISNGIKLELFGLGFFLLFAPESPLSYSDSTYQKRLNDTRSEIINGVAVAGTGSFCDCNINGATIGGIGQYFVRINGLGIAPIMFTEQINGVQLAGFNAAYYSIGIQGALVVNSNEHGRLVMLGFLNMSNDFKGFQLGIINYAKKMKGIQVGLWNINEKRQLPFVNWQFKD